MQTETALRLLGGSTSEAARWIGVVDMATRRWKGSDWLQPPTRDRVIAATLRKAAAKAQGLTVTEWWENEEANSRQLEVVLEQHNEAVVEFLRSLLDKSVQPLAA